MTPLLLAEAQDRNWISTRHHRVIDKEFRELVRPGNQTDILIISCPPRFGKSTYLSHWAPAHYLLRHPTRRVMLCSYGMRLAKFLSRRVRDRVHMCAPLFGLKGVNPLVSAADDWELDGPGGGLMASGVEGSIIGRGANLILIDDYIRKGKDAASATVRDNQWEWFQSTVSTRREPNAKLCILACLTGDALVWMADGSQRPMKDVRPGEKVQTFRSGKLTTSTVNVHCCLGYDDVFRVRLQSGKTVTGNGHHPFLVEHEGVLSWVQLKNLSSAMRIVTAKGNGEKIAARSASGMDAAGQSGAEGIAIAATQKNVVSMVTERPRSRRDPGGMPNTNTDMESLSRTTSECSGSKTAVVHAVGSPHPSKICIEGRSVLLSITTTNPERFEGCSVRTATLQQEELRPIPPPLALLDTSSFMLDSVVEVSPMGRQPVYDLQVEETQAFVANGMVTHNTPWHSDDLIGRIMAQRDELGLNVRRVAFQAIRVKDGTPDPLGREEGESLWPDRWPVEVLEKQRRLMGPYWWQAQYQGVPGQYGRNEWPATYFSNIWAQDDEWPERPAFSAVALDPSKGAHEDTGDFQAICYACFHAGVLWLDFDVDRRPVPQMMRDMARFCYDRRPGIVGIEANAFQDLLAPDYLRACQDIGYNVTQPELITNTVSKLVRIMRLATYLDDRKIRVRRNAGGEEFIRQAKAFPNGDHDDALDAAEMAIRLLNYYVTGDWSEDDADLLVA